MADLGPTKMSEEQQSCVAMLLSMGFELEQCVTAVQMYGTDLEGAATWILTQASKPDASVSDAKGDAPQQKADEAEEKPVEKVVNIDPAKLKELGRDLVPHKAVWLLDVDALRQFSEMPALLNTVDHRGQTPLSLALRFEYDNIVQRLLELGADPRTNLKCGWSVLELLCCQGKLRPELQSTIMNLYIHKLLHRTQDYEANRPRSLEALQNMPDFYLEIQWDIQSWIPGLSSFAPSDTFKIWKRGASIRFDSFVRGFSGTTPVKGHLSYVVTKDTMVLIDHERQTFENAIRKFKNPDYDEMQAAVRSLMRTEQGRSALRTDNVAVSYKKTLLGYQKQEAVGGYDCRLATCANIRFSVLDELKERPAPAQPDFNDYFDEAKDMQFSFCPYTVNDKNVNVDLWLTDKFPVSIQDVAHVLKAVAPASEDVQRLADIFQLDFPRNSFPVKLVIPLMMSVSASVTFSLFEPRTPDKSMFEIPSHFRMIG